MENADSFSECISAKKIVVGNRCYVGNIENAEKEIARLRDLAENVLAITSIETCYTAVDLDSDKANLVSQQWKDGHKVFGVTPHGKFVPALNALLDKAAKEGADYILFLSTEVRLSEADVQKMINAFDAFADGKTLVIGARLDGHEFHWGKEVEINGTTTPWNTCAMYDVKKLCRLGIPSTGEALFDSSRKNAGVEEVATISLYQSLYNDCQAKLIELPGVSWQTEQLTGERLEKHLRKMLSKIQRPSAQLAYAKLKPGKVIHIAG